MENTHSNDGLRYTGQGNSLIGVPARDLTADEVKQFGRKYLLASGIYAERYTSKPTKSALKGHTIGSPNKGMED